MQTSINIDSFKDQFVSGLIYSLVEGLNSGESIRIESASNFRDLINEICSSSSDEIICGEWSQSGRTLTAT